MELDEPFQGLTVEEHAKLVIELHHRPNIPNFWPYELKYLIQRCWSVDIQTRPTCEEKNIIFFQVNCLIMKKRLLKSCEGRREFKYQYNKSIIHEQ